MNFSGVPSRSFAGKLIRMPLRLLPKEAVVPIVQGKLKGARWIVGSGVHGYWLGSYEWDKQIAFLSALRLGQVVFDIGAHVGFYTLLASRIVGTSGKVFAFEPCPRNLYYLQRHVQLNRCSNVAIKPIAISDRLGTALFSLSRDSSTGHLSVSGEIEVRVSSLDEQVYNVNQLPFPDVLKVDVEGAEFEVLRGAENMLRTRHPVIFLATHSNDLHLWCIDYLNKLQYNVRPIPLDHDLECVSEVVATYKE